MHSNGLFSCIIHQTKEPTGTVNVDPCKYNGRHNTQEENAVAGRYNAQEANAAAPRINTLEWTVVKECYQTNNNSVGVPRTDCPICLQFERT